MVIIPAYNEEEGLPRVLADIPPGLPAAVVVVDNGSSDGTARVARRAGALVVREGRQGYGAACLAGIAAAEATRPEAAVFLDADYSDHPEEMPRLLEPLRQGRRDLVIGSRVLGSREPRALPPHARMGNLLAVSLIWCLFGHRYTDLGPFRAVGWESLRQLGMRDAGFGWTVEMQVRALQEGLRVAEVPVSYRRRTGSSKISGRPVAAARAGSSILATILRLWLRGSWNHRGAAPP